MIRASAPGSIMITGEHAVVYGHRAIVAAIDQRMTVTLTPRTDGRVRILSGIAPPHDCDLADLEALEQRAPVGPYRFVLSALARHRAGLGRGVEIAVESDIDPTLGLGSSAAVTVASLGALCAFTGRDTGDLHAMAVDIVQRIQGRGSGADLAASLTGGMLAYRAPPRAEIAPLPDPPPLSLKYCGYKTPTGEVLRRIAERMVGREAEFDARYAAMGRTAEAAITAADRADWPGFAAALTRYQGLMADLGVSDATLDAIVAEARAGAGVLAAKISGSGLGDCVLALGAPPDGFTPVRLAQGGVRIDG